MIINSPTAKAKNYYTYSASGVKLRTEQRYDPNLNVSPVNTTNPANDGLPDYMNRDYAGNIIYETAKNGSAITNRTRILVDGGYWENNVYYFYVTDHLGNNRVVVNQSGTVTQKNHYYPFGTAFADKYDNGTNQPYKYNGKELDGMHQLNLYDYSARYYESAIGRFTSVDPLAEKYYSISPYAYVMNNPLRFIDPDGRKIKIANNATGAIENVAKIAATTLGAQVLSHLIGESETYTMNGVFWTGNSNYNPKGRTINYVESPWYKEVPNDGGALTSMLAMGHETMHGYDHSNNVFNEKNVGYSANIAEPRAVSFTNYLREAHSLEPLRNKYGDIKGNFHQFTTGGNEKISNFSTIGHNKDKTSYGFSYTKTTKEKELNRFGYPTGKNQTIVKNYYMTVSTDKDKNVTFKFYENEDEYKKATQSW